MVEPASFLYYPLTMNAWPAGQAIPFLGPGYKALAY